MPRLALLLALIPLSCSGETGPAGPGDPARGETVFLANCVACHQADGSGQPAGGTRIAADLGAPGGPLVKPDEELLATIRSGRTGAIGAMPPWAGILSARQQRDVLAYLRARFTPPPLSPPAN